MAMISNPSFRSCDGPVNEHCASCFRTRRWLPRNVESGLPDARRLYDILGLERGITQDEPGIRASYAEIDALIRRENGRGIPTGRIVLAGFSQGGAMSIFSGTRYPDKLAGIMALSCYMLLESHFAAERTPANQATPIFIGHGTQDPVVSPMMGEQTRQLLVLMAMPSNGTPMQCLTPYVRRKWPTLPPGCGECCNC